MDAQLMLFVVDIEGFFVLFVLIFRVDIDIVRDWSQPGLGRERGGQ